MRLKREKLKLEAPTSFSRFLGYSNPKYELEWFHKLIADHCQMLLEGKIKNLMVFMPPQHGKSEIISRNFPAWALGQNPDLKNCRLFLLLRPRATIFALNSEDDRQQGVSGNISRYLPQWLEYPYGCTGLFEKY